MTPAPPPLSLRRLNVPNRGKTRSGTAAAGSFEEIDCGSYVEGVKDMLAYLREHRVAGIPLSCLPTTMTVGQLEAVVSAFIRRNPQLYNAGAAPAVYAALVEAFPCR